MAAAIRSRPGPAPALRMEGAPSADDLLRVLLDRVVTHWSMPRNRHMLCVVGKPKSAKTQALDTIQRMPSRATWDDIIYEMHVRQKLDAGVTAANAGRTISHADVKRRFLRPR